MTQSYIFALVCMMLLSACTPNTPDNHDDHAHAPDDSSHREDNQDDTHQGHDHDGEHGDEHGEGLVELTKESLRSSDIRIAPVQQGALDQSMTLPAEIELNPDKVAHINPLVDGQLLEVNVQLGERVTRAQDIARLRSVTLGQARAELTRTRAIYDVAKRTLDRQESLRKEGINSKRSLLEAQLAKEEAKAEYSAARSRLLVFGVKGGSGPDMTLESPIEGVVLERHATRGENVTSQDTLFVIADLSTVWVMGHAYVQHISALRVGMMAHVTLDAYPGRVWTGKIDFMSSKIDESTRTLPIRIELVNEDEVLKPGMFGQVRLSAHTSGVPQAIMVPDASIFEIEGRSVVFEPGERPTSFKVTPVTVGESQDGHVEVIEGLKPQSRIVVQGGFILKSELMRSELGEGHAH